jgi:hypothetical protein
MSSVGLDEVELYVFLRLEREARYLFELKGVANAHTHKFQEIATKKHSSHMLRRIPNFVTFEGVARSTY